MEFWGQEIKGGQPVRIAPDANMIMHLSQASLSEAKKGSETVLLNLKVDSKNFVLGTLSHEKFPQLAFDLVFDREFEVSHNWRDGSVYIVGYKSAIPEEEFSDDFDSDEEEPQLVPVDVENGKQEAKGGKVAVKADAAKPEASGITKAKPSKDGEDDSDEDEESDESDSDEEMQNGVSDESEEDDEEETPKKAEPGKKRPAEPATKTPVLKKIKAMPQKTDGKKGGHVATPYPAKKAEKAPANKAQPQTPTSGGKFPCNSCNRSFTTEMGLQSHTKAKHGGS